MYPGIDISFHYHHSALSQQSKHRDRQPNNPNRADSSNEPRASSRRVITTTTTTTTARTARLVLIPSGILRNRRHVHVVDRRVHTSADECFGVGQGKQHHTELTLGLPQSGAVGLGAGSAVCPINALADASLFQGCRVAIFFVGACGDRWWIFEKLSARVFFSFSFLLFPFCRGRTYHILRLLDSHC